MFQNQALTANVSCTVDRITACESESTLSDRQMDLTEGFKPEVGLVPANTRVIYDFLQGRQTPAAASSPAMIDANAHSIRASKRLNPGARSYEKHEPGG